MTDFYVPQVGDHVTVLEWLNTKDNSYKGDSLTVHAVDEPFIVVSGARWSPRHRFPLDLRRVRLKALSMQYVVEMYPAIPVVDD